MANDTGMDALNDSRESDKVKRDLAAAGYKGEKLVFLAPTDLPSLNAISEVVADMYRKIGMNLDYVATVAEVVRHRRAAAYLSRYATAGIPGRAILSAWRVLSGNRVSQQPDRRAGRLLTVLQCPASVA